MRPRITFKVYRDDEPFSTHHFDAAFDNLLLREDFAMAYMKRLLQEIRLIDEVNKMKTTS